MRPDTRLGKPRVEVSAWTKPDEINTRLSVRGPRIYCHWVDQRAYELLRDLPGLLKTLMKSPGLQIPLQSPVRFDAGQDCEGFGEEPGDHGRGVREASRMQNSRLYGPADDDDGIARSAITHVSPSSSATTAGSSMLSSTC